MTLVTPWSRRCLSLLWLAAILGLLGCSADQTPALPNGQINIKRLAMIYNQFVTQSGGRPPRDAAEFHAYVEKQKSSGGIAAEPGEDLLISPRDGKPYLVVYRTAGKRPGANSPIIYEEVGVDGKRQAAFAIGIVEEVDEARLSQLTSP